MVDINAYFIVISTKLGIIIHNPEPDALLGQKVRGPDETSTSPDVTARHLENAQKTWIESWKLAQISEFRCKSWKQKAEKLSEISKIQMWQLKRESDLQDFDSSLYEKQTGRKVKGGWSLHLTDIHFFDECMMALPVCGYVQLGHRSRHSF